MDYIKESEKILRHYRRLQLSVPMLEKQLSRLCGKGGPSSKVTAVLDLSCVRASSNRSAEQIIFEIMELQGCLVETKERLEEIDQLLLDLSSERGCDWHDKFLREWYVDNLPRAEIEAHFDRCKRNLYNMRDEAIKAFAVAYFGIRPFRTM